MIGNRLRRPSEIPEDMWVNELGSYRRGKK